MQTAPARCRRSVAIEDITGLKEQTALQRHPRQPAVLGDGRAAPHLRRDVAGCSRTPSPRADNFFNITRNFAFIGIMALGMTAVIITGGIDLSVGSIMGLVGVVCGLMLQAEQHWVAGRARGASPPAPRAARSTAC